jgi:hypothetical protein
MSVVTKIYPDFDPGIYDASKIFLQADAITGALEKINLPDLSLLIHNDGSVPMAADWDFGGFLLSNDFPSIAFDDIVPGLSLINSKNPVVVGDKSFSPAVLFKSISRATGSPTPADWRMYAAPINSSLLGSFNLDFSDRGGPWTTRLQINALGGSTIDSVKF